MLRKYIACRERKKNVLYLLFCGKMRHLKSHLNHSLWIFAPSFSPEGDGGGGFLICRRKAKGFVWFSNLLISHPINKISELQTAKLQKRRKSYFCCPPLIISKTYFLMWKFKVTVRWLFIFHCYKETKQHKKSLQNI